MAKCIKRVGIVFFVLVLSLLLALGTICVTGVVENNSNSIVNTNSQNNILVNENNESVSIENDELSLPSNSTTHEIPKSEYVFELSGTCTQIADGWTKATQKSLETGKNVKVVLMNDWVAEANSTYTTSFGNTNAFNVGRISVNVGVEITLDLNGKTINRNLVKFKDDGTILSKQDVERGNVIFVAGKLNIMDSKYDAVAVSGLYKQYKSVKNDLRGAFNNLEYGKITGGSIKSFESFGGGIGVFTGGELNFYSGIIAQNYAYASGAIGIVTDAACNIYGGLIFNNSAHENGGIGCNQGDLNIYGGIISFNEDVVNYDSNATSRQGGGIWYSNYNGKLYISNAIIAHNTARSRGAGILVSASNSVTITSTDISYNDSGLYGAGIYVMVAKFVDMLNSTFSYNTANGNAAGIFLNRDILANFDGLNIHHNVCTDNVGAIYSYSAINLKHTIIAYNQGSNVGGLQFTTNPAIGNVITIKSQGVQIYGNTKTNGESSNVYLEKGQTISIYSNLSNATSMSKIGVRLSAAYSAETFTNGYSIANRSEAKWYFYSDDSTKKIATINGEAGLQETTETLEKIPWHIVNGNSQWDTTDYEIQLPYNGKNYKLTFGNDLTFLRNSTSEEMKYFEAKNAGSYAFYYNSKDCATNVIMLTILPKEVNLEWETTLTYNGTYQTPKVNVKKSDLIEGDTCSVNVVDGAKDVGEDYYARVLSLASANYKANPASKYGRFKIVAADLTINITTDNVAKSYTGNSIVIGDKWYNLLATLLGQDSTKSLNSVFNIDYSKFIPMFTKDGVTTDSAINVGKYDISVEEFDTNSVFTGNSNYNVIVNYVNGGTLTISTADVIRASVESGYSYLLLDENNKRTAYETKGLVHGENDSNVNIKEGKATYVLGNIKPNTAVNTFINNLVFDTAQINLYNSQGKLIYTNGGANEAEGITEDMLNSRLELAIGTGWYIEYNVGGNVETIYLSVLGDINGDGRISASDCTYLRELANNETIYNKLNVEFKLAGLIINKGGITSADSEIILNVMAYKLTIDLFY